MLFSSFWPSLSSSPRFAYDRYQDGFFPTFFFTEANECRFPFFCRRRFEAYASPLLRCSTIPVFFEPIKTYAYELTVEIAINTFIIVKICWVSRFWEVDCISILIIISSYLKIFTVLLINNPFSVLLFIIGCIFDWSFLSTLAYISFLIA